MSRDRPDRPTGRRSEARGHARYGSGWGVHRREGDPNWRAAGADQSEAAQGFGSQPPHRGDDQFGDHHDGHVSPTRRAGHHEDDWYGGEGGRSMQARRYGSRYGHGSNRREPPVREDGPAGEGGRRRLSRRNR